MKKTLLFLLFLALSQVLNAQQKKVAVYVSGEATAINKILGDRLVDAFTNNGKFIAVERTSSFLVELSKEQSYQRTGAVSDLQISRLGEQFGVDFVCVADVSEVFGEKYVSARLVDVETAEVVNSANAYSPMNTMDELLEVTTAIATKLTGKTPKELLEEKEAADAKAKKIFSAYVAKCAEKESDMRKQLAQGYLQVGNYYIAFPDNNSRNNWITANSYKNSCVLGGFNDWRFPNEYELKQINDTLMRMKLAASHGLFLSPGPEVADGCYLSTGDVEFPVFQTIRNELEMYYDFSNGILKKTNNSKVVDGIWLEGKVFYNFLSKAVESTNNNHIHIVMLIRRRSWDE